MARFYTTTPREFTDEYIYKAPVDLMNQMVIDADKNQQKSEAEIDKGILPLLEGLSYYEPTDRPDMESAKNELLGIYNNVKQKIYDDPWGDHSRTIADARMKIAAMTRQGGSLYNLNQNLKRRDALVADAKKNIADTTLRDATIRYIEDDYLNRRIDESGNPIPLTTENMWGTEAPFAYSKGMNVEDEFLKYAKMLKPDVYQNGLRVTQQITKDDVKAIKQRLANDIMSNQGNQFRSYMEHADRVNLNGNNPEDKWFLYDENGNIAGLNTNGRLWSNLGVMSSDIVTYNKQTIKSSGGDSGSGSGNQTSVTTNVGGNVPIPLFYNNQATVNRRGGEKLEFGNEWKILGGNDKVSSKIKTAVNSTVIDGFTIVNPNETDLSGNKYVVVHLNDANSNGLNENDIKKLGLTIESNGKTVANTRYIKRSAICQFIPAGYMDVGNGRYMIYGIVNVKFPKKVDPKSGETLQAENMSFRGYKEMSIDINN